MKKIVLIAATAALVSYGSSGNSSSGSGLFRIWEDVTRGSPFDLRGAQFSTPIEFHLFFDSGTQCSCTLTIRGDNSSGAMTLNSCSPIPGTGDGKPNCNDAGGSVRYSSTGSTLILSDGVKTITLK
jgi:hypothetical protein